MRKKRIKGIPWRYLRDKKFGLLVKLCCFFCLCGGLPISANAYSQHQRISVNLENVSLETLISEIKSKVDLDFLYNIQEL